MNIGKSIKVALAVRGLNQNDLANRMGCQAQTVSRWANNGSITSTHIKEIADALEMKVSDFIALGEE